MSFYGHCLELYVSKGAKVKAGQKIAAVGTTGSSSGCHLHFGMHKNGSGVDPLGYVKDSDTISNYTGKSGASAQNIVKAMFTAYYPANNAMEGGFLDALGNPLDTSKRTCAAPKSVPFGTKVTVQGTNSELDGVTYTVNDRGGMITIENGVYHFDLLMSTEAECNRWGVKYGTAAIGGDGVAEDGAAEEKKTKEITKVVVKSTTGAAGKHKEALRNQPAYLQNGVDILIQNRNNVLQSPSIKGDVVWDTARRGVVAEIYGGQG